MSKTVGRAAHIMGKRAATGGYDPSGIDSDAWEELEGQLEATIPNYDRVNKWMTFGQDKRWRRNVRNHATPGMKVLEVGCGLRVPSVRNEAEEVRADLGAARCTHVRVNLGDDADGADVALRCGAADALQQIGALL